MKLPTCERGFDYFQWGQLRNERSERYKKLKKLGASESILKEANSLTMKAGIKSSKLFIKTIRLAFQKHAV